VCTWFPSENRVWHGGRWCGLDLEACGESFGFGSLWWKLCLAFSSSDNGCDLFVITPLGTLLRPPPPLVAASTPFMPGEDLAYSFVGGWMMAVMTSPLPSLRHLTPTDSSIFTHKSQQQLLGTRQKTYTLETSDLPNSWQIWWIILKKKSFILWQGKHSWRHLYENRTFRWHLNNARK
jgi:hypothetical protein